MMLKVLFNFLEENNLFWKNLRNSLAIVSIGLLFGYPILTIGQEMSMICFLFGFLVTQIGQISLPSSVEWSWTLSMEHKETVYLETMTMLLCQLGTFLLL